MKSKRELPFPNAKLEKKAIKRVHESAMQFLQESMNAYPDDIDILYNTRYEALCFYNGCEGTTAADKFFKIVEKAEKAILKLM